MQSRRAAAALLFLFVAANSFAQANNPGPASATPPTTVVKPQSGDPTQDLGERKLSRRERRDRIKALDERYQQFLRDVEPILLPAEENAFLLLESDAQRDHFIDEFWRRRDADRTGDPMGYRDRYMDRLVDAKSRFRNLASDRSRIFLIHGEPADIVKIDCDRFFVPIEIWFYNYLPGWGQETLLLFYQPRNTNDYRLWRPIGQTEDDLSELLSGDGQMQGVQSIFFQSASPGSRVSKIQFTCKNGDVLEKAIYLARQRRLDLPKIFTPPAIDEEDVTKMLRSAVISNPNAPALNANAATTFPGKRGGRTAVEFTLLVDRAQLGTKELDGTQYLNLDITGEVLKDGKLFESYRYRYDYPAATVGGKIAVVFERFLRPADYTSRIKIADVNSGAETVLENPVTVPYVGDSKEQAARDQEGATTLRKIYEDVRNGESSIRIAPLPDELLTGLQHIETLISGEDIKAVEFFLDGRKVMTKRTPPYTLDLDFGSVPQPHRIRIAGLDEKGKIVTGDEIVTNSGTDPFRVRIVSPRVAVNLQGRVRVEVAANAPEGKEIGKVEIFYNETRLASLYTPPYVQTVTIPEGAGVGYLRAVAHLKDDDVTPPIEDVVFINTPEFMEQIEVHLVELPTTVLRDGRPLTDLPGSAFKVLDEGSPVKVEKFEYVRNLPLSIGLAVDASGSMRPRMLEAQRAGAEFLKNVLKPGDKAFVVAFDSQTSMVQKWSPKLADLTAGLASLRAEEATALHDAIVYSLYNFQGVKGQRALVVISDGKDTASSFTYEQALEYARRSALPIYIIGIGIKSTEIETRYKMAKIVSETGGNIYYIEKASDLGSIYRDIQNELRSQYLLGFYPPAGVKAGSKWREVSVVVDGAKAKTIRGYYP